MNKIIEVGMFCKVGNSTYVEYGILKNDIVYVAGDLITQVEESDPYALRKVFVCAYVKDNHVDAERKPLTIDGKNLKPVCSSEQANLYALFEEDFKKEESEDE